MAEWTCMIYLAGDNNLSPAGSRDLAEMRRVGSTHDVNVVVQFDNADDQGTERHLIEHEDANQTPESLGETDSGDPQVLNDFIVWAVERYPAERYALVLWNHGGGWEPLEMDRIARSVRANDYNVRESTERSATPLRRTLFRTSLEKIFSLSSPSERAICSDDGSGHSLDTIELGNVLKEVAGKFGMPLDLLGMDACLMSNFEVAYQVRPYVKYMVASEENEPNNGWPYDMVLRQLVDHPTQSTPEIAAHIVQSYIKSYVDIDYSGPVTQAACNLSKVDDLAGPLDELAVALASRMEGSAIEIWKAQRNSARFWHNTLWDITHFCEEFEKVTLDDRCRQASQRVRAAMKAGADNFIIAESHHGERVERCGGSTVYFVPPILGMSRYYGDLDWAKESRWLAMLEAYHNA